jgi:cation diffusion facilitator family transporter
MSISRANDAKRRAALASVVASGGMMLAKFAVGMATGSIGILGEAAHSLLDLGATLITFFAVRVSDKPPDDAHHYGHGKIESVAALSETGLLVVTSAGIVVEAVRRLIHGGGEVEVTWWSAGVIAGSILVDVVRSRSLARVALATRSPALEADALHFASDILSSSAVLTGLGLVALGYPVADSIAAIAVAGFVCLAAWRLGRSTIDTLIDRAPAGIAEQVQTITRRTPGVVEIGRIRARPAGATLQVEIEAGISRRLPLDRMEEVRRDIGDRVRAALPEAEVSVSTFPVVLDDETLRERILLIAAYHGHPIHHITIQHLGESLSIGLDIEVDGALQLDEAHATASRLEEAISGELGGDIEIVTHIEPHVSGEINSSEASADITREIAASASAIARDFPEIVEIYAVRVREGGAGMFVSFNCSFAPDCQVDRVHDTVSRIETGLRQRWPIHRIITHAEPAGKAA